MQTKHCVMEEQIVGLAVPNSLAGGALSSLLTKTGENRNSDRGIVSLYAWNKSDLMLQGFQIICEIFHKKLPNPKEPIAVLPICECASKSFPVDFECPVASTLAPSMCGDDNFSHMLQTYYTFDFPEFPVDQTPDQNAKELFGKIQETRARLCSKCRESRGLTKGNL